MLKKVVGNGKVLKAERLNISKGLGARERLEKSTVTAVCYETG